MAEESELSALTTVSSPQVHIDDSILSPTFPSVPRAASGLLVRPLESCRQWYYLGGDRESGTSYSQGREALGRGLSLRLSEGLVWAGLSWSSSVRMRF